MHDFLCSDPDDMYSELMAEKTRYLKADPEGMETMYGEFLQTENGRDRLAEFDQTLPWFVWMSNPIVEEYLYKDGDLCGYLFRCLHCGNTEYVDAS